MDYGAAYTDKKIDDVEKRLRSIYQEAAKDIDKKMDDFNAKYKVKEQKYQQKVASGEMSQDEFDRWKASQVFQGQQWQAKKEEIANVLYNSNKIASNMVNQETMGVFMTNGNYASYQMEHDMGCNFGFSLYDKHTVTRLIKDEPNLLPQYTPKKAKDMNWNTKNITRQITQGIIQGESLDKIAKRLATATASTNMNSMKTHARTLMTGAQNAGRLASYESAEKLGIDMEKEWMATLDAHTRDSHKGMDGETAKVKEEFSNGLMYPGDPSGFPAEVYNCRCTMVSDIKKYPSVYNRLDNQSREKIKNMSYKDWEEAKAGGKSMAPYSMNKMAIGDLFKGLSQNGAYTAIHDVDTAMSNQFYKELQEMGKAYPGGAKPAQVWKDYQAGNLPDGVSPDKLEKIMADYQKKAQTAMAPPQVPAAAEPVIKPTAKEKKEIEAILKKYGSQDELFLLGGKDFDKIYDYSTKTGISVADLWQAHEAKAASNGVSAADKAAKTKKAVESIPKPKDAQKESFKSTDEWIAAAKKNPKTPTMLKMEDKVFMKMDPDERNALTVYTGSAYRRMNGYLRNIAAGMSEKDALDKSGATRYIKDIERCKNALGKSKLEQDLVLRRGTDYGDIAGLFMKGDFESNSYSLRGKSAEKLNEMFQGSVGEYAGFTSTSSQWNKGFTGEVEVIIYAPKGSEAASIMRISQFGTSEGETLLNAGTKVVCEKIEESDGHFESDIRVFLRIIE